MKPLTKDMTFDELLKAYPKSRIVLKEFGLSCMECKGRKAETLAMGTLMNGIDIDVFIKALRSSLLKEGRSRARSR